MTATERTVAATFTPPRIIIARAEFVNPLSAKIVSALNIIALIPENCWKTFRPTAIIRGT